MSPRLRVLCKTVTQKRLKELLHYNPKTGEFRWRVDRGKVKAGAVAGCLKAEYTLIHIDYVSYGAHRLAWLYMKGKWAKTVDHADGDHFNNRWKNLRKATHKEQRANATSWPGKLKGAYKVDTICNGVHYRYEKWRARIRRNGKTIHLGVFPTERAAHNAYMKEARKQHGAFAYSGKARG